MMSKKKGQLNNLSALGIGIAALAITLVVVFLILSSLAANTSVTADQNASAAVDSLQTAADDIPGWVPIIIVAIIGGILLALVRYFR